MKWMAFLTLSMAKLSPGNLCNYPTTCSAQRAVSLLLGPMLSMNNHFSIFGDLTACFHVNVFDYCLSLLHSFTQQEFTECPSYARHPLLQGWGVHISGRKLNRDPSITVVISVVKNGGLRRWARGSFGPFIIAVGSDCP